MSFSTSVQIVRLNERRNIKILAWDCMKCSVMAEVASVHFFVVSVGGVASVRNTGVSATRKFTVLTITVESPLTVRSLHLPSLLNGQLILSLGRPR